MTRRVVAFEGKESSDLRLLLPDSLRINDTSIPVSINNPDKPFDGVIGRATAFERDFATGEISFDILTPDEILEELNAYVFLTDMVYHYKDKVIIISSALIREIHFSKSPSVWPIKGRNNG